MNISSLRAITFQTDSAACTSVSLVGRIKKCVSCSQRDFPLRETSIKAGPLYQTMLVPVYAAIEHAQTTTSARKHPLLYEQVASRSRREEE